VRRSIEVGRHHLSFVLPAGWEHLDHGRQQLFRNGENVLSLADLGPATRAGVVHELREAQQLWLAGRRKDAFARVDGLHVSPVMVMSVSEQKAEFWRPWTDATYIPDVADSPAIGRAFDALIEGTRVLPEDSPDAMLEYALDRASDMRRRLEIVRRTPRPVHGSDWTEVERWDRVTHLERTRLACLESRGRLLVLNIDRGPIETTGPVFDSLLASIVVAAADSLGP
jgi:hypothetical protein